MDLLMVYWWINAAKHKWICNPFWSSSVVPPEHVHLCLAIQTAFAAIHARGSGISKFLFSTLSSRSPVWILSLCIAYLLCFFLLFIYFF